MKLAPVSHSTAATLPAARPFWLSEIPQTDGTGRRRARCRWCDSHDDRIQIDVDKHGNDRHQYGRNTPRCTQSLGVGRRSWLFVDSQLGAKASAAVAGALERLIKPSRVALCGAMLQATLAVILVLSSGFLPYAFSGILFVTVIIVTHTFIFGWLACNDASGRAVALTPAMAMSGAAIGPLLGGLLGAGFGIPSLGIVALVIGVVSFTSYRFAFRLARPHERGTPIEADTA